MIKKFYIAHEFNKSYLKHLNFNIESNSLFETTRQSQNIFYRWGFLCFDVEVTSNQLWHTHYSPYQSFLYNKIKQLKSEGLGYRKIAKRLNEENIKTSRGNAFYPSSVFSILKKKKIRDERLNKVFDKKISKFWFEYSSN
jgi:hypothetical protein